MVLWLPLSFLQPVITEHILVSIYSRSKSSVNNLDVLDGISEYNERLDVPTHMHYSAVRKCGMHSTTLLPGNRGHDNSARQPIYSSSDATSVASTEAGAGLN